MERLRRSTNLVLTGLLLLFSQCSSQTTDTNSSGHFLSIVKGQIAINIEETSYEQNSGQNNSLVETITSDVRRRFVRNTAQGEAVFVGEGRRFVGDTVQATTSSILASDSTQCCWMCQQTAPDTSLYHYNTNNKKCYCRKPITGVTLATEIRLTVVSGFCDAVFTECLKEDNTYLTDGNPIQRVQVGGEDECANLCANTPECKFWQLYVHGNECKLSRFSLRGRSPGFITGTKSCGIDTPAEPSESICDISNCLDTENCQDGHCQDVCARISCRGRKVCLARDHNHYCVQCKNHEDCEDSEICSSNKCYSSCAHEPCKNNPKNRICLLKHHNYDCVQCTYDGLCDDDEKCSANNQCVQCTYDGHCNDDEKCLIGSCLSVCSSNICKSVSNRKQCIPENHRAQCVRCIQDEHCGNDEKCEDHECTAVCTSETCSQEIFNKQCKVVNHNAQCVKCTQDNHCNNNNKCDASNECTGCTQDEDCNDDEKCSIKKCNPVCTSKTCHFMTSKKQCISINRRPGCVKCSENHHCSADEKCENNDCVNVCDSSHCIGQSKSICKVKDHAAQCVSCTRDVHCDEDKKCDDKTNECINACSNLVCSAANTECLPKNHKPKCQCKSGYKLNKKTCELITEWTDWVDEGVCSEECGGGLQEQTRQCLNIWDNQLDETECPGQRSRQMRCNTQLCGVTASSSSGDSSTIVDGNDSTHFSSSKENYPWVQLEYTDKIDVSGIRIKLHQNSSLTNLEVRIGDVSISEMIKPETVNAVCKFSENISTAMSQRPHVDIVCDQLLTGNFITIQKKQNDTWLQISKIEPILPSCFEFGYLYFGKLMKIDQELFVNITSAEECQKECQIREDCQQFNFYQDEAGKECRFLETSLDNELKAGRGENYITGSRFSKRCEGHSGSSGLSLVYIILIILSCIFLFILTCFAMHAVHTCKAYKAIEQEDINYQMKTRKEDGCCLWTILHTKKYISGDMFREILEHGQLRNAEIDRNSNYGYAEPEDDLEIVDYNPMYGQSDSEEETNV